jgi:hypothetical protein
MGWKKIKQSKQALKFEMAAEYYDNVNFFFHFKISKMIIQNKKNCYTEPKL